MSHTTPPVEKTVVSAAERAFYNCPPWCVRTDHHADVVTDDYPPIHYGPDFGAFWPQGTSVEPVYVVIGAETTDVTDPAILRQIAADAYAAADWLAAHQDGGKR